MSGQVSFFFLFSSPTKAVCDTVRGSVCLKVQTSPLSSPVAVLDLVHARAPPLPSPRRYELYNNPGDITKGTAPRVNILALYNVPIMKKKKIGRNFRV